MQINHYVAGPLSVNCFLVVDDETKKAFIVDPGGESNKLLNHVQENNINVEAIILTHGHPDHICGIEYYKKAFPAAIIVAHEDEKLLLGDPVKNSTKMYCGKSITVHADRYVSDNDSLKIGNLELVFIHTPGHTPGGMCIYVEDSLFSGDTLFFSSIGRTDFPYSSYKAIKDAIRNKLFVLPKETRVYPGHESFTDIGFEKEHNPFV